MDAVYEKFQNGGKINGIPLVLLFQFMKVFISRQNYLNWKKKSSDYQYIFKATRFFLFLFICIAKYSNLSYTCNYSSVDWCDAWEQILSLFLLQILSTLVTASAPTYLYFALEGSRSRNLWLVSPATFLVGSIYTFTVIIPEVNVMLDENVIEKKGGHLGQYCLSRNLFHLGQKSTCIIN